MELSLFEEIYADNKLSVYKVCLALLKNREDAEDATQESFLKLYNSNRSFSTIKEYKYFLIRIGINTAKDILRKRHRKVIFQSESLINPYADIEIFRKVDQLSSKLKEVIVLKYIEDMSFEEISSTLSVNPATVRKRHERALSILREKVNNERT